jgi:hypothetical protein
VTRAIPAQVGLLIGCVLATGCHSGWNNLVVDVAGDALDDAAGLHEPTPLPGERSEGVVLRCDADEPAALAAVARVMETRFRNVSYWGDHGCFVGLNPAHSRRAPHAGWRPGAEIVEVLDWSWVGSLSFDWQPTGVGTVWVEPDECGCGLVLLTRGVTRGHWLLPGFDPMPEGAFSEELERSLAGELDLPLGRRLVQARLEGRRVVLKVTDFEPSE